MNGADKPKHAAEQLDDPADEGSAESEDIADEVKADLKEAAKIEEARDTFFR